MSRSKEGHVGKEGHQIPILFVSWAVADIFGMRLKEANYSSADRYLYAMRLLHIETLLGVPLAPAFVIHSRVALKSLIGLRVQAWQAAIFSVQAVALAVRASVLAIGGLALESSLWGLVALSSSWLSGSFGFSVRSGPFF